MFVAGYSYCFSHAALRLNIVKTAMQLFGNLASAFCKLLIKNISEECLFVAFLILHQILDD